MKVKLTYRELEKEIENLREKIKLKEREKRFEELFEKSGDAILILENERFIDCNQATVNMLKYDTKELFLDVHPSKLSPKIQPDGRNSIEKADEMMGIALKKGTHRFEWNHVKSTGEVFPVEVLLTVISNTSEKRVIHTVWRDITDRRNADYALKQSEEKFRGIIETVSDWIWEIDEKGKYTYSSPKVFSILGYTENEVLGKTPFDFMPEVEKEEALKIFTDNSKHSKPIDKVENKFIHKNGEILVLETSALPFFNSNNKLLGYRGIDRDITASKKIEKSLKDSEEQYRNIIESTSEGCWVLNSDKVTIDVNTSLCEMLGYTRDEMIGKKSFEFVDAENAKIFESQTGKIPNTNHRNYEISLRSKSGKEIPTVFNATTIIDADNKVVKAFAFVTNVTQRKKVEQALIQSEASLRESNKTKDKFFSILAHDLISPFNTMMGFSKLLVHNFDNFDVQKQKKFIGIINHDVENTYKLLENLLLWSRAQSGTIDFNPEKENLYLLIGETFSLLSQQAENKEVILISGVSEDVYVDVDKNMLLTILRNLISNAIKFTPKGGEITVSTQLITDKNQQEYTQISVKDTGMGISKEKIIQLFKISENVSTKGTEGEEGTGLGLILCKEFVEKHGGKIWVESEVGQGSEFTFTILSN